MGGGAYTAGLRSPKWGFNMAYVSTAEIKSVLNITGSGDDWLIDQYIEEAESFFEVETGRIFETTADSSRTIDTRQRDGPILYLPGDLCQITSIVTKADSSSGGNTLTTGQYLPEPRYETPYWGIRMLTSSTLDWDYADDPEMGVTITGRWGYSVTPPKDVKRAVVRLAAYFYRQKDSQIFEVTAFPGAGEIRVPMGIPSDVQRTIKRYRRRGPVRRGYRRA